MLSLLVIEHLDVIGDASLSFVPCFIYPLIAALNFECLEEALGHSVVPTVGSSAHAGKNAVVLQELAIVVASIL